jgi:hypothetical protein
MKKETPLFLTKIDFTDLRSQKTTLLNVIDGFEKSNVNTDDLKGILNLIDALQDYAVDEMGIPEMQVFDFELEEERDMTSKKEPKLYFKIVQSGYNKELEREEIQIHAGENGNLMIVKTDEGFVVDAFDIGGNNIDTMAVWEDDINPDVEEEFYAPENFSDVEIVEFKKAWGRTHNEICTDLGYNRKTSDDLLMLDYFWIAEDQMWYNKSALLFNDREQAIANYLRLN